MQYTTYYDSPLGKMLLAADHGELTGLWFENQKYYGATLDRQQQRRGDLPIFIQTKDWLDRYFAGEKPEIAEIPLGPAGSSFRKQVWKLLCEIPYGTVVTYGDIAREMSKCLGKNMSAQAVGGAVGHNPVSIIIPCHRVVGAKGNLTGYAGGIARKEKLLELEGMDMTGLFAPPEKGVLGK